MAGVRLPFRGVALTLVSALGFALIGAGSFALRAQFDAPAPSDAAAQAARTAVLPDPPARHEPRGDALVVLHAPAPSATAAVARRQKPDPAPASARAPQHVTHAAPAVAPSTPTAPAPAPRAAAAPADHVQLVDMTTGHVVASGAAVDDAPTGGTVCPLDGCP